MLRQAKTQKKPVRKLRTGFEKDIGRTTLAEAPTTLQKIDGRFPD
jgi:hypothetical protein